MLTVGELIKKSRRYKGITLNEIAYETKIKKDYLKKIERNQLDSFDSPAQLHGFIKNIADYIGIESKKITAIYKRQVDQNLPLFTHKPRRWLLPNITISYRTIAYSLIFLFFFIGFFYLVIQFYRLQQPPILNIIEPTKESFTTNKESLTIKGVTDSNVYLSINSQQYKLENNGTFNVKLPLIKGSNTFVIQAQQKDGGEKITKKTLVIDYADNVETVDPNSNTKTSVQATPSSSLDLELKIGNEIAWVQVVVDDEQKIAQILQPGTQKQYQVKKSFFIITGRPSITNVTVNGEKKEWISTEGGWKVECTVKNKTLSCQ